MNKEGPTPTESTSPVGYWTYQPGDGIVTLSERMRGLVCVHPQASSGTLAEVFGKIDPEDLEELHAAFRAGDTFSLDVRVVSCRRHLTWLSLHALFDRSSGQWQGTAFDVSERKLDELMLIAAKEEADELNSRLEQALVAESRLAEQARAAERVKSQFLTTMSHELRTPLNGILGFTKLLEESGLSKEQRECVDAQQQNGDVLLAMINQILEIAQLDAEEVETVSEPFSPLELIEDLADEFASRAQHVAFGWSVLPEIPAQVLGDSYRLRRALGCLLDNAFKFTESGSVELRVRARALDEQSLRLRFEIEDTGIGIAPEAMATLFKDFTQVDASMTRRYNGSGLGLSLARRLCQLQEGQVDCRSEPGRGSIFTITVKVGRLSSPEAKPGPREQGVRPAVMVDAEESVHGRHLCSQLRRLGVEVLTEGKAAGASAQLVARPCPQAAATATQRLREAEEALPQTVVLFSHGTLANRQQGARAAETDKVLALPVRLNVLAKALAPILRPEAPALAPLQEPRAGLDILLVEDNPMNRKVASLLLKSMGHRSSFAENGREGLERLRENRFDIVLMDLQMPVMDGIEAARRIRQGEAGASRSEIPIVAVTANDSPGNRKLIRDAGIDDCLPKPLKPDYLRTALGRYCTQS
ncbi:MAG: response regulator [Opitutales bacterium]